MMKTGFSDCRVRGVGVVLALAFGISCGGARPPVKEAAPAASASAAGPTRPTGLLPDAALKMNQQGLAAYSEGITAYATGDLAGAKKALERAIAADSNAYQAHYSLGVVLEHLGESQASSEYRKACTVKADYEPAIIAYAFSLAKKGNLNDAETFLQQKRGRMADSAAVIAALAEIKSLQRDTASAQQLAQEALKKNSDYRPAMVVIARDHYRNRRLDLALYALQAILDGFGDDNPPRDKDNAEARYLRGLILKEEGKRAAAISELREAVRLRPDNVSARLDLAGFFLEAGNAAEAQPHLEWAIRYDPNNATAHLNLGDCYRLTGRYGDAKKEFEWVLLKDSSLVQGHYDLALLYLFAPNVPGMTPKQQADQAVAEITKYQQMRGRLPIGQSDDSEELLNRAKQKQVDLQAQSSAKEPVSPGASPATAGAAPAGAAAMGTAPAGAASSRAPAGTVAGATTTARPMVGTPAAPSGAGMTPGAVVTAGAATVSRPTAPAAPTATQPPAGGTVVPGTNAVPAAPRPR